MLQVHSVLVMGIFAVAYDISKYQRQNSSLPSIRFVQIEILKKQARLSTEISKLHIFYIRILICEVA